MTDPISPPTGTVTFLFTDIEGSTRLWQDQPEAMRTDLTEHDAVLGEVIAKRHGHVFKHTGDGVAAAFASAGDAVDAAVDAQERLVGLPFRVRMGLHTGEAQLRDGDYFGPTLNRCARLMAVAHGGQIVLSAATAELVRDRGDLLDLGEHRLRDLAQAERVSQVGAAAFAPLRSLGAVPGNLPAQLTSFVGRDDEVAGVAAVLREHRIVTITGVGGVGKTRVAIQVAAEVSAAYEHGVWLIELAPVLDADALPYALASTLGVRPQPMISVVESVQQFLAERRVLLVFDNCEHLLLTAGRVVESLARTCPGVSALATSREALAIDGERIWPLASLPAETDAVVLFADRARAARPSFDLQGDDVRAVEEICRRLDGIPLAIELAAARTVMLSPSEIAGRLDERFRLLTGGRRTAIERHQTLRATVDWSYGLLDESTRTVFDRLAVFAGGFTFEAAEAVVPDELIERYEVLEAITSLVSKSMVIADRQGDGTHRYRLLETLRQYGQERLAGSGTSDALRVRHARYMAEFTARARQGWRSVDEQRWRHRLADEIDNLRAAVGWAIAGQGSDLAARLVGPLSYQALFYPSWGLAVLADATLALPDIEQHPQAIGVLTVAAVGALLQGDLERVLHLADRAFSIAEEPGREISADIWATAAAARTLLGDFAGARRSLADGMTIAERLGDPFQTAVVASFAAALIHDDGPAARACANQAASAIAGVSGPEMHSYVTANCALAYFASAPQYALALLEEATAIGADIGASHVNSWSSAFLAVLYADQSEHRSALVAARDGIVGVRKRGELNVLAYMLEFTAVALSVLGFHDPAAVLYAVVDARIVGVYTMEPTGWRADVRMRGRNLTLAALGEAAIEQAQPQVARMTLTDIVTYTLTEINKILDDLAQ